MPLKKFLIKYYLMFVVSSAFGQTQLTGTITDIQGVPLPFATVYEEGTTNGTTTNIEGKYQLTLDRGPHRIVAQYIGYQRKVTPLNIPDSNPVNLNFELESETLVLQEVVVSANERDPARAIIRKAIQKRKFYEKEFNAYSCEVYIKGLQRLDERPKSLLGMTITIDTGIVYLSESISKVKFHQPDKMNETMISSKVSGQNNAFSYNMASDMLINLYQNSFFIDGLSERSFISPLSNSAFLYYDYKLAGTIIEDSLYINKIRVLPKRDTDPTFSGFIYIIEDSWRMHSVDISLTKENGIEFVDTLTFNQIFAPVEHGIWMPISQRFTFKFKAFGFKGSGHFTSIYRKYEVEPNYELFKEEKKYESTFTPDHQEKELFQKKDFTKAILKVEEGANEKDSIYWNEVRPIPLTPLEVKDYHMKDSIRVIKDSKPYKDSIDAVKNEFKIANLFLRGYTHYNSFNETNISFPTIIEGIQYNTVEGLVANLEFSYTKRKDRVTDFQLTPSFRYGFANEKFQSRIRGYKMINPKRREYFVGGFGRYVFQFNESNPITAYQNTLFTLIQGRNYARLYQKSYVDLGYQLELINGLHFVSSLTYSYREPMTNNASYNIRNRTFDDNTPFNEEIILDETDVTDFTAHQSFIGNIRLRFRFAQKYIDRPDRKVNLGSKYPELNLAYKVGLPIAGSDVDYHLIKIGTEYEWRMGLLGTSQITAWAGDFLRKKKMYFLDFEHFNGNRTYLSKLGSNNSFQVLRYYEFSTQERFIEAHYEHHFNEFIFNKIPFVRRLNFQAVASVNYLNTPTAGQYFEFGGGIEHIFRFLRIDYFTAIRNGDHYGSGIRIGAGF